MEGERLIVIRLLQKRFGQLPRPFEQRLERATLAELEQWSMNLLTASNLDEVFKM